LVKKFIIIIGIDFTIILIYNKNKNGGFIYGD